MKSFSAILMALAASASFVAAMPAPGDVQRVPVEPRGHQFYALHVREPKNGKKKHDKDKNGNSTVEASPANNGTADGNDDNDKDNGKGGDAAGILQALLGLLNGGAAGQKADGADAAKALDPLAILQGLLNAA